MKINALFLLLLIDENIAAIPVYAKKVISFQNLQNK